MTTAQPGSTPPRSLRRVGAVLAMLALGQLGSGIVILSLADPASAPLGATALLLSLAPGPVAAATLRARAPGEVTSADLLTLLRHLAAGALAAASVLVLGGALPARSWPLALLIAAALASDALDGPVARRTGTAGPVGARIDMEADAALNLVLSVLAATVVGPWALAFGLMRYGFVTAAAVRPALSRPLAFSRLRRLIGATQGVALLLAVVPAVPTRVATAVLALALGLLVVSFARDVIALEQRGRRERRAGRSG